MITAVDSCIILDVLSDDPEFADRSIGALKRARNEGRLIVCEMVVSEIAPIAGPVSDELMEDMALNFVACDRESAISAGESFATYLSRGGKRGRIVADFLIAEHAGQHADRLLTRDVGFQRDYFDSLNVWYPE